MKYLVPPTIRPLQKAKEAVCALCEEVKVCGWKDTELPPANQLLCKPCMEFAGIADCNIVRHWAGVTRPTGMVGPSSRFAAE